ncbi:MAG: hypothetical protein WKF41_05335 [Gaiellaceae bacterium]
MSPEFRKVAIAAAVLGFLLALFIALRPEDEQPASTSSAPTTTAPVTTSAPVTTTGPPPTTGSSGPGTVRIDYTITGGTPQGGIARDSVSRGRIVVLRVSADVADHVHLHGYDLMANVAPGAPARIRFVASVPGRFEIELEDSGVQIGELEVRP